MKKSVCKIFVLLIILSFVFQSFNMKRDIDELEYQFMIRDNLKIEDKYISFETKINSKKVICYYYLNADETIDINYNNVYSASIKDVRKIENTYDNPSSFNYQKYMYSKKINEEVILEDIHIVDRKIHLMGIINNMRYKMISRNIERYENMAYYMNALVFGYNDIPKDMYQTYIDLSLVHIFAISGTHVIILSSIIRYVLSLLKIKNTRIDIILVIILLLYSLFANASPSVVRAVMMVSLKILSRTNMDSLTCLQYVLLINLILNPFEILSQGFVLTYLITFILIVFSDYFSRINNSTLRALVIQFYINLFIFPITNNMNYSINIFSYLLNIIIVPIVMIVLFPLSLILTLLNINLIYQVYSLMILFIESMCSFFDIFTYYVGHINIILAAIYVVILFKLVHQYMTEKKISNKYMISLITIFSLVVININIFGSVNIVDVGQGDGILIRLPLNQGNIVIDIGNEKSTQEMTDYLKYLGINSIDGLVITHMHDDHYGDLNSFNEMFKIKSIFISEFNDEIVGNNVKTLKQGDELSFKGYKFDILGPFEQSDNLNNQSLVIRTKLGKNTWLFMGDAEKEEEEDIIDYYQSDFLKGDKIKIGHHGSNTSTSEELLQVVNPNDAFISVGENNIYKHPSEEVITRLEEQHIDITTTMDSGLIHIPFMNLCFL